ncbi:hypothetical protein [Variovorax sp.]|uniref:hypothetical protein n=1 Tax=Variovorax sp. TaxID=1871043 RepID=UPI002D4AA242|nr:hypothetical protein [Variovorax sp.]HYP83548.1 hypothetical protein [Variovorax sp.]
MSVLQWLDFEYSDGDDGIGVFDALASVFPQHAPSVQQEIDLVLAWARAEAGPPAPMEAGGEWDVELQVHEEPAAVPQQPARRSFGLTISGTPAFCQAFGARFLDERG